MIHFKRFVLLTLCLSLFACSARINGSFATDGSAALSVNISLEPGISALIQRLSAVGGQSGPILNGLEISQSMSQAPGVSSVSLRNTAPAAVEGQVRIISLSEFLDVEGGFISFSQGSSGGRCVININLDNGPEIAELLSSEISDYLNALMAPIATGEEMDKQEYLDIVTSFYGRVISNEIASSRIRASIDFPGTVTNVQGGTFTGRRVNFDIPLLDLLVLETPLVYEVNWN